MIITEIGRGLGNSMYVYAAAKSLAKHHNTELKLDTSYLKSWPRWGKFGGDWEPEIKRFNISAKIANKKEIKKFLYKTHLRHVNYLLRKFRLLEKRVYDTLAKGYPEKMSDLSDNIYLRGYFGNEKFFREIKNEIKKEFTLKEENKKRIAPLLKKISEENSVGIHVRRGDLISLGALVLPIDYYRKAINKIKKNIKNPKFYVFSDEIEWCKENFKDLGINPFFIRGNKGWEDLELMRNCKHNILANSALSWWAGYLNPNPGKIVIAPEPFTHWVSKDSQDNLPKKWVRINVLKNEK